LKLYPNPFTNILHITNSEGYNVKILSQTGAIVHTQKITSSVEILHLQHLSTGVYFLRLEKDGQIKTMKIVKQ
jgi:hypothetical protein